MNNKIIKYDFVKYLSFPLQSQYLALLKFLFLDETNIKLNEQYEFKNLHHLVVVKEVDEHLHDAGEEHEDGADTDAEDDVVIRLIFFSFSACQHFKKTMPGYDLVS